MVKGVEAPKTETVSSTQERVITGEGLKNVYRHSIVRYLGPSMREVKSEDIPKTKYEMEGSDLYFGLSFRPDDPDMTSPKKRQNEHREKMINNLYKEADHIASAQDPKALETFVDENIRTFSVERKIHLQPKKEFLGIVVDRLMKMVSEYPELRTAISSMKMSIQSEADDTKYGVLPEVVIYAYGKQHFEKILQILLPYFQGYEKYTSGKVPRMNQKVNDLVFVAQSGGDFKSTLQRAGLLDQFFDPKTNHAFLKGEGIAPQTLVESTKTPPTIQGAKNYDELVLAVRSQPNVGGQKRREQIAGFVSKVRDGKDVVPANSKLPPELIAKLQELGQMQRHRQAINQRV